MSISWMKFKKNTFDAGLLWPSGVASTIVYALAKGSPQPTDEALLALHATGRLGEIDGVILQAGMGSTSYSVASPQHSAKWVDIYSCDLDAQGGIVDHQFVQSAFNGSCRIAYSIKTVGISPDYKAVQISVENRSAFDIEPGGIGYRIGSMHFAIPCALKRNLFIELPQFEVRADQTVLMHAFGEKYPATFSAM